METVNNVIETTNRLPTEEVATVAEPNVEAKVGVITPEQEQTETDGQEHRGRGRPAIPKIELVLTRTSKNQLNPRANRTKVKEALRELLRRRKKDIRIKQIPQFPEPKGSKEGGWKYQIPLRIDLTTQDKLKQAQNVQKVLQILKRQLKNQWLVELKSAPVNIGEEIQTDTGVSVVTENGEVHTEYHPTHWPAFQMPAMTEEVVNKYFNDVYERNPHINIINDSLHTFYRTGFNRRSHVLMYGPPATAKTKLLTKFRQWITDADVTGAGAGRFELIDGPSASRAGFERWLLEKAQNRELPQVLMLEEIEKNPLDSLLSLLSLMQSGYLQRVRAYSGKQEVDAPILILGTCNDEKLLRAFRQGALWSRFGHKLYAGRPSKELMKRIVHDEAKAIGLEPKHADAVINIWLNYESVFEDPTDPREIIALLDGGDRLLNDSYLRDLQEIAKRRIFDKQQ